MWTYKIQGVVVGNESSGFRRSERLYENDGIDEKGKQLMRLLIKVKLDLPLGGWERLEARRGLDIPDDVPEEVAGCSEFIRSIDPYFAKAFGLEIRRVEDDSFNGFQVEAPIFLSKEDFFFGEQRNWDELCVVYFLGRQMYRDLQIRANAELMTVNTKRPTQKEANEK